MFRTWLSRFYRNNKVKIDKIAKLFGLLIVIGICAGMFISFSDTKPANEEKPKEIYKPKDVTISGGEVTDKQFEEQNALIKEFVDYCNAKKNVKAYSMLTDECKDKLYPTLEDFENKYCKMLFTEEKDYNIQAWITEENYTTYKIRYTEDIMASGTYEGVDKYEDYVTVVGEGDNKKINVNGYVKTEKLNKKTKTENLEIEILNLDIYMDYVTYTISFKNTSDKEILLDTLDNSDTIKLIGTNGANYRLNSRNLTKIDLRVVDKSKKEIQLTFVKTHGSQVKGSKIEFEKIVTDYQKYKKNTKKYEEFKKLSILL